MQTKEIHILTYLSIVNGMASKSMFLLHLHIVVHILMHLPQLWYKSIKGLYLTSTVHSVLNEVHILIYLTPVMVQKHQIAQFKDKDKDKDVFIGPKEFVSHMMIAIEIDLCLHSTF